MSIIRFCQTVPRSTEGISITSQLIDSAGSTDSNYRAVCKARSRKEFISRIGVCAEEADESLGWLQTLRDAELGDQAVLPELIREANELTAIFVSSHKTATKNLQEEEERRRVAKRKRRTS